MRYQVQGGPLDKQFLLVAHYKPLVPRSKIKDKMKAHVDRQAAKLQPRRSAQAQASRRFEVNLEGRARGRIRRDGSQEHSLLVSSGRPGLIPSPESII